MKTRYYPKMSFIVFIGVLTLSAAAICRAEEITLTTYYPSPYGVYSEMRLFPKPDSTTPCVTGNPNSQPGVMFYDSDERTLKVCVETSPNNYAWQRLGSGLWELTDSNLYPTQNSWNVGIGTQNPATKLTIDFGNEIAAAGANGIALIGNNNPGIIAARGAQELFTIGGVTSPGSYTSNSQFGDATFVSGSGRILFGTGTPNSTTRMAILGSGANAGNVGIGTTSPQAKLDIGGFANGRKLLLGQSPGGDAGFVVSDNSILSGKFGGVFVAQPINGNRFVLASYRGNPISFWTATTDTGAGFQERLTILGSGPNAGFVGIGTTNPQETLHVNGDIFVGGNFYKSGNLATVNSAIGMWGAQGGILAGFSNGRTIGIGQTTTGYTGLGITQGVSPLATFYVGSELGIGTYVAGPPLARIWAENPAGFAAADVLIEKSSTIRMRTQQMDRLIIDSSGNIFIPGNVNVSGAKNFKIPHPLDQEHKYLIHSCLEGPEAGVYYRGEGQLKNGIAQVTLPEYFEALTRKDGRSALLTNIDGGDILYVETQDGAQIRNGKFIVKSSNPNSSQRFNWEVKAVRGDIEPLEVEVSK